MIVAIQQRPMKQLIKRQIALIICAGSLNAFCQDTADINGDGCVQLNDLLTLLVSYGNCDIDESSWQCGDALAYQGYNYQTVQIGDQCWFAENLKAEKYANNDNIAMPANSDEWFDMANLGMTTWYHHLEDTPPTFNICSDFIFYDNTPANEMKSIFGNLYNQAAVDDSRGICPSGWHVPSAIEWDICRLNAGFDFASSDGLEIQWCNVGGGDGGGGAGLNIKPAGTIDAYTGSFYYYAAGWNSFFWTTTQVSEFDGWYSDTRIVVAAGYFNYPIIPEGLAFSADYADGNSVRCIRDVDE